MPVHNGIAVIAVLKCDFACNTMFLFYIYELVLKRLPILYIDMSFLVIKRD